MRLFHLVELLRAVLGEDVGDAGGATHGDHRGDARLLELLGQFHLLLGHVEEAAHVRVVDLGGRGGVHHADVPEVLRGVDHRIAAGDGLLDAFGVARVHEHGPGLVTAVRDSDGARLLLVVVAHHDLLDLGADGEFLDGPASHGAGADDGDLHDATSYTGSGSLLIPSLSGSQSDVQTDIIGP